MNGFLEFGHERRARDAPPGEPGPSRRAFIGGAAAVLAASPARSDALPVFRVGTLPYGTAHWAVQTITDDGLDIAAGIRIENVSLSSGQAARINFLSGSVDSIVTDLLFAVRLRAQGRPVRFLPFSTADGGLVVKPGSPIKAIGDLVGKSIGVAGGALDKNWLLLRATAEKRGIDLAEAARAVYGAPPLLSLKVENGELDAGLLYWTYTTRLRAKGYREVASIDEIVRGLGVKGRIAFTGFIYNTSVKQATLEAFGKTVRQANAKLADAPAAWTKVRPLMEAPDERTYQALKEAFQNGIPRKSREEEIADAKVLYAILAGIGGEALVGKAMTLPDDLFADPKIYG